ncbi:hypothetical protein [Anoxynatronum buryatiense]|uniref:Uncharacterized protein n=1 Tax=Anoxynatronum buryatiense TaxID=489973 RepID=A0AA45WXW6_9CLOT|nr:hypothetical protein [Anoxynatronum buryatiense]SMP66420.1 hypothetical protein SAMN06296020_11429 [Anoxynatronum buryatiense]
MKVTDRSQAAYEAAALNQKKHEGSRETKAEKAQEKEAGVVKDQLIKGEPETKATYEKPAPVRDEQSIQRLMDESNRAHQQLRELVIRMLERQGMSADRLKQDGEPVNIDNEARAELEAMLGPDGEYGVEKTSDRIVDFAIALSGGDKEKAELLRDAIIQGFKEAEKALGGLPEISQKTYDRVMEKFDAWVNSEN